MSGLSGWLRCQSDRIRFLRLGGGKTVQFEINRLAEFKDEKREKEFHDNEVRMRLHLSEKIVLVFAVVDLLFVFSDYTYLQYADVSVILYYSFIPRAFVLAVAVFVFILLEKIKDKSAGINSVVAFAIIAYLTHEYIAVHFAPVDPTFEVLDLVIMTYGLFIIPNRWITNVWASALLSVTFFLLTPLTIPTMKASTKIILFIYLLAQVLMLALLIFKNNVQKRLNYLQQIQLEALAKTDMLTKASNRVACDMSIYQMCANHRSFSLLMVDIDNFKIINDTYGHLTGDKVIVKTVEVIRANVRQNDIVARWGGDEFIVITVSNTNLTLTTIYSV